MEEDVIDIWRGSKIVNLKNDWLLGNVPDICLKCQRYLPANVYYKKQQGSIANRYLVSKFQSKRRQKS